jgi:Fe-S cluster assembly protein SufD
MTLTVDARPGRVRSLDPAEFPVPSGREEEWRFTPFLRLRGLHRAEPAELDVEPLRLSVDGPATLQPLATGDPRLAGGWLPGDRVAALAYAAAPQRQLLTLSDQPAGEVVTVRIRAGGGAALGHLVVEVPEQAEAVLVLEHTGSGTVAGNIDLRIGDGARLTLVSLQDWADDTVHLGQQAVRLGRDARLHATTVTLGGELVRIGTEVAFAGPGGEAILDGLFFADAHQHLEHRLFVDHAEPHCRSLVTYKGALAGARARTVWVGDVLIRAAAVGTDTYEVNRNLLLTDGARADSVPNLEIETGDVARAGHASATGRFDDEQLFYLQSRGIPAEEARRLVVRAFFADLLARMPLPGLRQRVADAIEAELAGALG